MPAIYVDNKAALPPRAVLDHYPTPLELCRAVVNLPVFRIQARLLRTPVVLDPGAGTGVWGQAYKEMCPDAQLVGVELDTRFLAHPDYASWLTTDFLALPEDEAQVGRIDTVIGNPPYKEAEEFIRKSLRYLNPNGGKMAMLLRTEFQNSVGRARGLWREYPPSAVRPLAQRPSFNGGHGTQPQDYTLYIWELDFRSSSRITRWEPLDWRPEVNNGKHK